MTTPPYDLREESKGPWRPVKCMLCETTFRYDEELQDWVHEATGDVRCPEGTVHPMKAIEHINSNNAASTGKSKYQLKAVTEIEQKRRDLKGSDPEFYEYVSKIERAKLLDLLGDELSAKGHYEAANHVWGKQ